MGFSTPAVPFVPRDSVGCLDLVCWLFLIGLSAYPSQGEGYIAVGCTTGIYVSKRVAEYCGLSELTLLLVTNLVAHSISESLGI